MKTFRNVRTGREIQVAEDHPLFASLMLNVEDGRFELAEPEVDEPEADDEEGSG